jgi:protein ImuB
MGRILCVWYPDWYLRRPDAPPDEPCQAVGEDNRVVAVNGRAAAAGIRPGMRRREAEAVCPFVVSVAADAGAAAAAFETVAAAVEAVVPRVEVAAPGLLYAPLAGAVRYFGGEGPVLQEVREALDGAALGYRAGIAAGPFAARRAAARATTEEPLFVVDDDAAFRASLDVEELGSEELAATFHWLGIRTLGDLSRLPRPALASRFGNPGLAAHRIARGEEASPRSREIPSDPAVEETFDPPLTDLEQGGFVARALAHRLLEGLSGAAPLRVEVAAESGDGAVRTRVWRSADRFDAGGLAERIRWQLRAWTESGGIAGGVARLRLAPADITDEGRQLGFHEDAAGAAATAHALARAQAIVGPDAVLQAIPQGGRTPGERVRWYRWGEPPPAPLRDPQAPWPGSIPAPAPALVPPDSQAFEVEWDGGFPSRVRLASRWETVLSWAGPWRNTGRWWTGEEASDRYQIVTSAGAFLCEVRAGRCRLIGVYD